MIRLSDWVDVGRNSFRYWLGEDGKPIRDTIEGGKPTIRAASVYANGTGRWNVYLCFRQGGHAAGEVVAGGRDDAKAMADKIATARGWLS